MKRLITALPFLFLAVPLLAQEASPSATPSGTPASLDPATAAAMGAGIFGVYGACCFVQLLFYAVIIGAWIFTGIFVMNDAKNRNSENAQTVTILAWLIWPVGLIMHLATRPKGNLVPCPHCQKKRLQGSANCPHCHQP